MANREKQTIDYSNITLPDIIRIKTKHDVPFYELETSEKRDVLIFIKRHKIDIKVFGQKWYDLLSNKFYVRQYLPKSESSNGVLLHLNTFESFDSFYEFLRGDIYKDSCFYGYVFSEREIKEYSLDLQSLNFDSFIDYSIDSLLSDSALATINNKLKKNIDRAKAIIGWFKRSRPVSSYAKLREKYRLFVRQFDFREAKTVFFSMLLRRDVDVAKEAIIEFACKHDQTDGLSFGSVLLAYGKDAVLHIIERIRKSDWPLFANKKLKYLKDMLAAYDGGSYVLSRSLGFNKDLQLYYVENKYIIERRVFMYDHQYFGSFEEFADYIDGDLSNADLTYAPILSDGLDDYKFNENTKYPIFWECVNCRVEKLYQEGSFIVNQKWLDTDGATLLWTQYKFTKFFNFVHFLNGDLSNADLLFCDGIENIKKISGLKIDGIKIRSDVAERMGLPIKSFSSQKYAPISFEQPERYEIETSKAFNVKRFEEDGYSNVVSYITDIHLLHRFAAYKCKTAEDVDYVTRLVAKTLCEQATRINLIGGDTSSDFGIFRTFVSSLALCREYGDFFFTLGNHELWGLNGKKLNSIIKRYSAVLDEFGGGRMHLVQNDVYYYDDRWTKISEKELMKISSEGLKAKTRGASVVLFGGIGFAGKNDLFNANNGIYMDVLNREEEIHESDKFIALYHKITTAFKGKNLIVLTHMPMEDWGGRSLCAEDGVVYVSGHNHRNYFHDDGKKRIYADNQIGYRGKTLSFKSVAIDLDYDWFADYGDGIYQITREDYVRFYRGINEYVSFNREYSKLFMIKREKTYMFLMQTSKGKLMILNGGSIRRAGDHSLEYFYEHLVKYSASINMYLASYCKYQRQISDEIKRIGGDGRIHGSIIDIDFLNHLYINPLDGTITPYFAHSMVDKFVYENLPSLLKYQCPSLFRNYKKLIAKNENGKGLVLYDDCLSLSKEKTYVSSTDMYRVSRILNGLQCTIKYNVVRLWSDEFVADVTKENGKMIVSGIINPEPSNRTDDRLENLGEHDS